MADAKFSVAVHDSYVVIEIGGDPLSSEEVGAMIAGPVASAGESGKHVIYHRLTPVAQTPSTGDFYFFAKQLEEIRFRRKIALVLPEEMHPGNLEFFETAASNRGVNIRLLTSLEIAVAWIEETTS